MFLPGLQWQLDTPRSVLQTSFCAMSHVESSPTMQVSMRTAFCCGFRIIDGGKYGLDVVFANGLLLVDGFLCNGIELVFSENGVTCEQNNIFSGMVQKQK